MHGAGAGGEGAGGEGEAGAELDGTRIDGVDDDGRVGEGEVGEAVVGGGEGTGDALEIDEARGAAHGEIEFDAGSGGGVPGDEGVFVVAGEEEGT